MLDNILKPISNTYILGHEKQESLFLNAFNSKCLHHAWLITGDNGIGKSTLAYKFARFLLDAKDDQTYNNLEVSNLSNTANLMQTKSHPDFKVLECDFIETDKKKILKSIKQGDVIDDTMLSGLKKSNVIKVDDVRDVIQFLSKKSFNNNWKIVIIDSADDLNTSSANAILKILEEPPVKTILFLVSHNPGRLLPTIRSRCTVLPLQSLEDKTVGSLLRRYMPQLKEAEISELIHLSKGSIGRAIKYAQNDALKMYKDIQSICYAGTNFNGNDLINLAQETSSNDDAWFLFSEIICLFIRENLINAKNPKELYITYENTLQILNQAISINQDKKLSVIQILAQLTKVL